MDTKYYIRKVFAKNLVNLLNEIHVMDMDLQEKLLSRYFLSYK